MVFGSFGILSSFLKLHWSEAASAMSAVDDEFSPLVLFTHTVQFLLGSELGFLQRLITIANSCIGIQLLAQ